MDNQTYLNQIAVKGKRTANGEPLLSPLMIKLLIAGAIMLITIIVVGIMVSSANSKVTQSYERLYLRISQMSGSKGPYNKYAKYINSSNLAGHAVRLETSVAKTSKSLEPLLDKLGVKKDGITKDIKNAETSSFSTYMNKLERASMSGQMDLYYSSQTAERIMQIITVEKQVLTKTNNDSLKSIINDSLNDLETLYENFRDFSNSLD
ncbi:hypothetical protein IKQ74_00355 [Candidatus Saccharibacteria bacterium]|nr:hypothetical protein [Candidatus Saccharibacteria bacterium]